jgi:hypothetical protein
MRSTGSIGAGGQVLDPADVGHEHVGEHLGRGVRSLVRAPGSDGSILLDVQGRCVSARPWSQFGGIIGAVPGTPPRDVVVDKSRLQMGRVAFS